MAEKLLARKRSTDGKLLDVISIRVARLKGVPYKSTKCPAGHATVFVAPSVRSDRPPHR